MLRYQEAPAPAPAAGEVLVAVAAAGVNFRDVYEREGSYPVSLPLIPGIEGAGTVTTVGPGVSGVQPGDRVAFIGPVRSYAEQTAVAETRLVRVPPALDLRLAAAVLLQGITAHYLTHSTHPLQAGDTCLVHAAAGGVGLLLTQMARQLGARVIGTTSSPEKAAVALAAGADHIILYTEQEFAAEVRRLTDGRGVDVVYDAVGKDTFDQSLRSLAPRGHLVLYGQASGQIPPFDTRILRELGSLTLTRPASRDYTRTPAELESRAGDVLSWVASGQLTVRVAAELPLGQAAEAHRLLESRQTAGKLLLIP